MRSGHSQKLSLILPQSTQNKLFAREFFSRIIILDLTLSDFSRPQLYAIWSVSIFPERLSRKCVGLNPKRRRMPIRLQKRDVDPGFTTHYLYNSTLQVMVGSTFVKYSITGVKGFCHIFLPNLFSIPQFDNTQYCP